MCRVGGANPALWLQVLCCLLGSSPTHHGNRLRRRLNRLPSLHVRWRQLITPAATSSDGLAYLGPQANWQSQVFGPWQKDRRVGGKPHPAR